MSTKTELYNDFYRIRDILRHVKAETNITISRLNDISGAADDDCTDRFSLIFSGRAYKLFDYLDEPSTIHGHKNILFEKIKELDFSFDNIFILI